MGYIARSKSMAKLAGVLQLDRKGLYKSFSAEGNPSFRIMLKFLDILGLRLRLEQKSA